MLGSDPNAISQPKSTAQTSRLDAYRALAATAPRSSPTSADVTLTRQTLDDEIFGVSTLLATLKERRNELALPSLLPPEILAQIFAFLSNSDYQINLIRPKAPHDPPRTLGWVYVSHVCRRWRHVCLTQPSLWTLLKADQHRLWDVFLERAKEAPLFITGRAVHLDSAFVLESILKHRHHIQDLALAGMSARQAFNLTEGLEGALRKLRLLFLSCPPSLLPARPCLPPGFLTHMAPNLEYLRLEYVQFPWGEGSTKLKILRYRPDIMSLPPDMTPSQFVSSALRTLQNLPALKELTLINALRIDKPADIDIDRIPLPHLESLLLVDTGDICSHLFSQLEIPCATSIWLRTSLTTEVESSLVRVLGVHLRRAPFASLPELSIDLRTTNMFHFSKTRVNEQVNPLTPARRIYVCISSTTASSIAMRLLSEAQLENVRHIHCLGLSIGNWQAHYDVLLPARSVTHVELSGDGARNIITAMIPGANAQVGLLPQDGTGTSPSSGLVNDRLLFPNLQSLDCTKVAFHEIIADNPTGAEAPLHDILSRALACRKLKDLNIRGCDVLEEWVSEWRRYPLAEKIEWDEREGALEVDGEDEEESEEEDSQDDELNGMTVS
ncbi:unnamed protein product [Peniophora sp. CBMAI 1063]|nr:unnamed protein product [Peniophora sp. CBMAI 1063]